jgi:hypothetical protein
LPLRIGGFGWGMIRGGFLSAEDRRHLIALARDGSAASRLTYVIVVLLGFVGIHVPVPGFR